MTQKLSACDYYVFQFAANRNMSRNEKAKKCSTLDLQNHLRKNANDMPNNSCNYFSIFQEWKSAKPISISDNMHLTWTKKVKKLILKNWFKYVLRKIRVCPTMFVLSLPLFFFCNVRPLQIRFKGFHNFTATLPLHAKPQFFSFFCIVKPRRGRLTSYCFESEEK